MSTPPPRPAWPSGSCSFRGERGPGEPGEPRPAGLQSQAARAAAPPAPGECELPAPGRPRGRRAELGCERGALAGPRPRHLPSARGLGPHFGAAPGREAGAMQSESGIVPDFEVGEEFHEEPKTYYELKSQPLKSR